MSKLFLCLLFGVITVAVSHTTQGSSNNQSSTTNQGTAPTHHANHAQAPNATEREKITKVNVTVYYEALCPDSAAFVTKQVYPLIAQPNSSLAHYININFVPFGKSTFNKSDDGNYTFECHHGPEECLGNKFQACAIKHVSDKMTLHKYINCTMSLGYTKKNTNYSVGKECADELKVDFEALNTCVTGSEGDELLANYGETTKALKPVLTSVPEVTFNEAYTLEKQSESMKNLKNVICHEITDSKNIMECAGNTASTLTMSLVVMVAGVVLSRLQ